MRTATDLARTFGPGLGGGASYLSAPSGGPRPLPPGLDLSDDDAARWPETSAWAQSIPSPLFRGIENSRRFRALPLFAGLMESGREGMAGQWRVADKGARQGLRRKDSQTSYRGTAALRPISLRGYKTSPPTEEPPATCS